MGIYYLSYERINATMSEKENRFHRTDSSYNEQRKIEIERAVLDNRITTDDAQLIKMFISEVIANNHVVPKRSYKLAYVLVGLRRYVGPYRENTMAEVYQGLETLQCAGYKKNTVTDYSKFLKRFCLWLVDNEYSRLDEKKLRRIKVGGADANTIRSDDLFTEAEVKSMMESCLNSKDRAWLMLTYEGALRPGEPCTLRWGDVKFTEYNVTINVCYKTDYPRYIPLYKSAPYLGAWHQDYPGKIMPDSYVFINTTGKYKGMQLQYQGLQKHINDIAQRAGIERHIKLHYFRHSSITQMIRDGVPETVIKMICWGTTETDMFKTYAHLVNADIDKAMAMRAGIITPERAEKSRVLDPRQCPRCYTINPYDQDYCGKCGRPLTMEANTRITSMREDIKQLLMDPEFRREIQAELQKP